jgi:hypothetical protein
MKPTENESVDLDEAAFPMIEDVLLGHDDMSLAELSEHVIDAVARHIEDHWVPTLPLTDTSGRHRCGRIFARTGPLVCHGRQAAGRIRSNDAAAV